VESGTKMDHSVSSLENYVLELKSDKSDYDDDKRTGTIFFQAMFCLYAVALAFAIGRLIWSYYQSIQNSTLRFYYYNLVLLITFRMIYFSDAFDSTHYPLGVFLAFSLLPSICLFTADTVLAFMWYKINAKC
jgi:hypothetical protein